jgi:hypothetical protein
MVVAPPTIPRPGIWARPIRGVRGDELRTHRMPAMPQDLRRPSHMQGEPADSASGHIRRRRHPRCSMACARLPAPFAERGCIQLGGQTPLPASRHRGHGWCRPWQAGSAAGRPGVPVLHRQPGAGALPALAAATASSSGTSSVGDRIQGLDLRLPRGAGSGALRGPGRRPCRPASADASWREIRVISPDASWQPSGSAPWEHRPAASRYMHATTSGKYGYYKFSLTLRMSPDRSVQAGFSPLTQPSSS